MLLTGWPSISIPILLGDHHMTLSLSWKFNAALSQLFLRKIQITGFTISPFPGSYEKNNLVDELCFWLVIFLNQVIIWSQPDRLNHTKSDCSLSQGCSHWAMPPPPSPLEFPSQTRSNSFSFKYQRYCFIQVLKNYTDRKFHDFYRVCYNFWAIYDSFSFFLTT